MTHCRRKFLDVARGGKADIVLEYMKKLYEVDGDLKEQKATPENIIKIRQKISKPVFEELFKYIKSISQKEGSKLAEAVGYALNHKSELATYLSNPEAYIDNNCVERAIRPFTIARKNFLFCDTKRGAEASARVFTGIECAKLNALYVFEYLKFLLKTLPSFGDNPTKEQVKSVLQWVESVQKSCSKNCTTNSNELQ